jgi:hypothetical protein
LKNLKIFQICKSKILNKILPLLKKNEKLYLILFKIYKRLDYHGVTFKFWWNRKSSKKKVFKYSIIIGFFLISYILITKILALTLTQFFFVSIDLVIRFIWIFFLRGDAWKHQTFDEKVKDYERFRKKLRKEFKKIFRGT